MSGVPTATEVAVVGGGPVGLALGALLARAGAEVVVLERRSEARSDSRSIGIHPPALAALEAAGASDALARAGVQVRRGRAFGSGARPGEVRALGSLSFERLRGPYPFVLTLPQHATEAVLTERLRAYAPDGLVRGAEVRSVAAHGDGVVVSGARGAREGRGAAGSFVLEARYVVGCDGRDSLVRGSAGIAMARAGYPDTFVMGDVRDDTALGTDAAIYLTDRGVVESFPLPGGRRRWVVKTPRRVDAPGAAQLADLVQKRVGLALDASSCTMLSSFGVERGRAERMVAGRIALAGDSGHAIPPIGGQGMNMGWLDAADLAPRLLDALAGTAPADALEAYGRVRARAWRRALRRAERNLRLGRATRWTAPRDALVRLMLAPGLAPLTARTFAMYGLG